MSAIIEKCLLCQHAFVGCKCGRCSCGMTYQEVQKSNIIFAKYEQVILDTDRFTKVMALIKKGFGTDAIIDAIVNEKLDAAIVSDQNMYCEFPVGSANKGAWVGCIVCGAPRFEASGKLCAGKKQP